MIQVFGIEEFNSTTGINIIIVHGIMIFTLNHMANY